MGVMYARRGHRSVAVAGSRICANTSTRLRSETVSVKSGFSIQKTYFRLAMTPAIRCANANLQSWRGDMANAEADIELDDEDFLEEEEAPDTEALTTNSTLARRRQIDDYLEQRRLQKELADYDFGLD